MTSKTLEELHRQLPCETCVTECLHSRAVRYRKCPTIYCTLHRPPWWRCLLTALCLSGWLVRIQLQQLKPAGHLSVCFTCERQPVTDSLCPRGRARARCVSQTHCKRDSNFGYSFCFSAIYLSLLKSTFPPKCRKVSQPRCSAVSSSWHSCCK